MRDYKKMLTILTLALLLACGQRGQETSTGTTTDDIDTTIVLVNYKSADRITIAKGIQNINKCNPKIIGINALFIESREAKGDSLLAQAIREKKNVILASNGNFERVHYTTDSLTNSNPIFAKGSLAEGLVHYGFKNNSVTSHLPYRSVADNMVWSYPITIASYYNVDLATGFMHNFTGDTYYKIQFHKNLNQFKVIDIDKLDQATCDDLEGKIVLMGYLGPTNEDVFNVDSNDFEKMYSTVITANIILNLLTGDPIVKDEEEVEQEKLPPTIAKCNGGVLCKEKLLASF